MVVPTLGLAMHLEAPYEGRRHLREGAITLGAAVDGRFELAGEVVAGFVSPTEEEWYLDTGTGWSLAPSLRAAVRVPVASFRIRPAVNLGMRHHAQASWFDEDGVKRSGLAAAAGCDLLIPVASGSWIFAGVRAELNTIDARPLVFVRLGMDVEATGRGD